VQERITTAISEIGFLEWGNPQGRPILALHGWLDNASSFAPLANYFLNNGLDFHLIAIDFPGHAHSSWRPTRTVFSFIDYIADIKAVTDHFQWDKFTILGHSMGGGLGSLFAGTFPDVIERLILIEALGPVTREANEAPENLALAIQRFLDHSNKDPESAIFRSIDQLVKLRLRAGKMKDESARLLIERGTEVLEDGNFRLRRDPRLNLPSFLRLTEDQVIAFLKRIHVPSLLIWGDQGYQWEKKILEGRANAVANLKQITLAGNHHIHMDEPEVVGEQIVRFLRKD
jgi:pimeloyl-ACP methyl ester carboxylesterase